ncbi:MAG: hypothetical protein JO072_08955 [Parafilimonas sp.]|nr:hypothetical protein [Parafilimonas sp.]
MKLTIYRIITFLLLPMAFLFAIAFMVLLRAAFANPPLFFSLFFAAAIAIYTFASLNFLIRGIDGKKLLGRSSKEWLIVNAIVSIIYAILAILQRFLIALDSSAVQQFASMIKKNGQLNIPEAQIIRFINGILYFVFAYGIVLFTHIILSFQYVKQYKYLFQTEKK